MEQNSAIMLARQLPIQNTQQQCPFSESPFGRLPGEVRQMIYECVLVAPSSQPTTYLRVPVMTAPLPDMAAAETGSTEPSQLTPTYPKNSYVAILQTCRQIYDEAFHIFYARNSFHLPNVPDLIAFVRGIGPLRRAELTSLHIEGLVIDRLPSKDLLDRSCLLLNVGLTEERMLAATGGPAPHPDMYNEQSIKLLHGCKKLSKIILDMEAEEGFFHIIALRRFLGLTRSMICLVDESHWKVILDRTLAFRNSHMFASVTAFSDYENRFSCWARGNKVRVEVDIVRNSEGMSMEGSESWIVLA